MAYCSLWRRAKMMFNFLNRSINLHCKRNSALNINVLSYFVESRRNKSRGDMYMPPEIYRIGGTSHGTKHYLPKFRKLRAKKILRLQLPDFEKFRNNPQHEEQMREQLKEMGLPPIRKTDVKENPYFLPSSMIIYDTYSPGDGMFSGLTEKILHPIDSVREKYQNRTSKSLKAITDAEPNFNKDSFGEQALNIYKQAHKALQNKDEYLLHDLVTELAFPVMWDELKLKSLRWQYVRSLEAPRVVHIRSNYSGDDPKRFGQVTVRFRSQQILAIFDQFGRLFMGSENVERDVLDYVVFEKLISDRHGIWRMHAKIPVPDSTPSVVSRRTYNIDEMQKKKDSTTYKHTQEAEYDDEKVDQSQPK